MSATTTAKTWSGSTGPAFPGSTHDAKLAPAGLARRALKRTIDLAVGSAAVAVSGPFMLVAALAVRISSPGPILFRQVRVGRDGVPFVVLKFRTMTTGASSELHERFVTAQLAAIGAASAPRHGGTAGDGRPIHKLADDPRITPVGAVLRRTSIDELPQLINVLRGDMSLVGPRPALAYETARYAPRHRERLRVRPGITGLWQVSGRSRLSMGEMLDLDVEYAQHWTVTSDLRILLRTPAAVLRTEAV